MDSSKKCYACEQPATTKEHVPPQSFFLPEHRINLMTVPSCERHNNDQSKDVEYTRNILSTYLGTSDAGQRLFNDKAVRSLERSPRLLLRTFGDMRLVNVKETIGGAFTMEVERIENVMRSCASALYFIRTGERQTDWHIVLVDAGHSEAYAAQQWTEVIMAFRGLRYVPQQTSSPEVFEYATAEVDGGCVYAMRFYHCFRAYAAASLSQEMRGRCGTDEMTPQLDVPPLPNPHRK